MEKNGNLLIELALTFVIDYYIPKKTKKINRHQFEKSAASSFLTNLQV